MVDQKASEANGDEAVNALSGVPESPFLLKLRGIEAGCVSFARRFAVLAVAAILVISLSTIVDVVLRNFFRTTIFGLNEVVVLLVAMATSTCLPFGLASGSALKMDLLKGKMGVQMGQWIALISTLLIAFYFALLGERTWVIAADMLKYSETTMSTIIPKAPFYFVMSVAFFAASFVQCVIALREFFEIKATATKTGYAIMSVVFVVSLYLLAIFLGFTSGAAFSWAVPESTLGVALMLMAALWLMILLGMPIGASMGVIGLAGAAIVLGPRSAIEIMGSEATGFVTKDGMSVLPLFLLMGAFAITAGIGNDLYTLATAMVGHIRGGLAHASILACAGFGTLTGSSLATQMSIGKIALAEMKARDYSPALAAGAIASGGTLGQLIPPSTALILYAILTEESVGQLFIGAVIPGLLATMFYMGAVSFWVWRRPDDAKPSERANIKELADAVRKSWSVLLLLSVVLGGLYTGFFTELEAGAFGAAGAFLIALFRGRLTPSSFWTTIGSTTGSLALIYALIFGVAVLSFFFGISGLPQAFLDMVNSLGLSPFGIILMMVACFLILGTVMDAFAIMVVTIPIFVPVVHSLGYDPIWWGIMTLMCVEAGMISPPFGLNMFVIASLDKSIPLTTIYRGSWPFFFSTLIKIVLLLAFPALVTWLPSTM